MTAHVNKLQLKKVNSPKKRGNFPLPAKKKPGRHLIYEPNKSSISSKEKGDEYTFKKMVSVKYPDAYIIIFFILGIILH